MIIDAKNGKEIFIDNNGIKFTNKDLEPIEESQIKSSKVFILNCCLITKHENVRSNSYSFKHKAEKFIDSFYKVVGYEDCFERHLSSYISNGAFIKACHELGLKIYTHKNSINCYFNLSYKGFIYENRKKLNEAVVQGSLEKGVKYVNNKH